MEQNDPLLPLLNRAVTAFEKFVNVYAEAQAVNLAVQAQNLEHSFEIPERDDGGCDDCGSPKVWAAGDAVRETVETHLGGDINTVPDEILERQEQYRMCQDCHHVWFAKTGP